MIEIDVRLYSARLDLFYSEKRFFVGRSGQSGFRFSPQPRQRGRSLRLGSIQRQESLVQVMSQRFHILNFFSPIDFFATFSWTEMAFAPPPAEKTSPLPRAPSGPRWSGRWSCSLLDQGTRQGSNHAATRIVLCFQNRFLSASFRFSVCLNPTAPWCSGPASPTPICPGRRGGR